MFVIVLGMATTSALIAQFYDYSTVTYLEFLRFHRVVQPDHAVVDPGGEELGGDGHDGPVRVERRL